MSCNDLISHKYAGVGRVRTYVMLPDRILGYWRRTWCCSKMLGGHRQPVRWRKAGDGRLALPAKAPTVATADPACEACPSAFAIP